MSSLLHLFLLCLPLAAQQTFHARVVDAKTGEALPYAHVYISAERGALTNIDGRFSIETNAEDVIQVSYIGYEKVSLRVTELTSTIKLNPLVNILGEVRAVPVERILLKLIKKLNMENLANPGEMSHYFMRMTNMNPKEDDVVVEAFFRAFSTININQAQIVDAQRFSRSNGEHKESGMASAFMRSNMMKILELAPEIPPGCRNDLSARMNLPLPEWANKISDLDGREFALQMLKSETGQDIYKIDVQVDAKASAKVAGRNGDNDEVLSKTQAMSGSLYIDKKKKRLLSFDGEITGLYMKEYYESGDITIPLNIRLHMDFSHSRHFTEPVVLRFVLKYGDKETRIVAFKVDNSTRINDTKILQMRSYEGDNMMEHCRMNGENATWPKDIILRSEEEERIANEAMKEVMHNELHPIQ